MAFSVEQLSEIELRQLSLRQKCVASDWYHPELAKAAKSPDIYQSREYLMASKELVEGRPCMICGSTEDICAHHMVPDDNSTLIPLCRRCHAAVHGRVLARPDVRGRYPPVGESPPLCACGCKLYTSWKRYRGWAMYRKGHGCAKVPAGTRNQGAPLCECGCGEQTKFRHGKGWNKYKRGHGQRIEGAYHERPHGPAPQCGCGCGSLVEWKYRSGYPKYILGHRKIKAGRKPPIGESPPKCACGCSGEVGWTPGHGWAKWVRNHDKRREARKREASA